MTIKDGVEVLKESTDNTIESIQLKNEVADLNYSLLLEDETFDEIIENLYRHGAT